MKFLIFCIGLLGLIGMLNSRNQPGSRSGDYQSYQPFHQPTQGREVEDLVRSLDRQVGKSGYSQPPVMQERGSRVAEYPTQPHSSPVPAPDPILQQADQSVRELAAQSGSRVAEYPTQP